VIGLAAACGGGSSNSGSPSASSSTGTPQRGGTLTIDVPLSALDLNPFTCSCEQASEETMVQLYDQLVEFMPGNLTPQPGLAKSWTVSKDQKTFTFNLRPAQFSNGRPETSADVKYMLKRISAPTATLAVLYSIIKKIATPNPETVVVTLSQPTPNFVSYLGSPFASVVSKAVITKLGDKAFDLHPVGSGAFELSHWAQGREVDLTRNPHYWRTGQPHLDAVKLMYVPDDNTRMLNLLSGSVDAIDTPAFSDIAHLQSTPNVETVIRPSANVVTVNLNEKYAPLSEKVVRQALIYATPTQEIQKVAFAGQGQIMNVDIQKLTGWNPNVKPYPYDVAKAKQLMSQSSTPKGFALSLSIVTGDQALKTASEILQSSWAKIGVKVNVNQLDFGTLMSKWYAQNYQANMTLPNATASDVPVLDEFATIDFNSASSLHNLFSDYSNPAAARLAGQAIHATDPATQTQLFNQLQQITMADPESVPILWPPMLGAVRSTVHGFDYVALGWWRLEQVWVSH
jgi:peptide/nickel transport system substrate-binding protein